MDLTKGDSTRRDTPALHATVRTGSDGLVICLLLIGALAVRLIPLGFGIESADILLYRQQAIPVVQMKNVYAVTRNVFPYTPVSMFYPALCLKLSGTFGIPFHIVIKLFAIFSDVGIVLALYSLGVKLFPRRTAICCASLYALSPVSILVSSFHGNVMPLVVLLMLTAYLLFRVDPDANLTVSGLLLGLAVGWRSFPILLLPFFLASIDGHAKKIRFAACVVVPVALCMAPFAWVDGTAMLHEMLTYSGWGIHHGPFGIVRGLHLLSIGSITWINPPEWTPWVNASKFVFLALYGIAVPVRASAGTGEVVRLERRRLGIIGQLVCLHYLLVFVWEIVFVLGLT